MVNTATVNGVSYRNGPVTRLRLGFGPKTMGPCTPGYLAAPAAAGQIGCKDTLAGDSQRDTVAWGVWPRIWGQTPGEPGPKVGCGCGTYLLICMNSERRFPLTA